MFERSEQAIVDRDVLIQKEKQAAVKSGDGKKKASASPPSSDATTKASPISKDESETATHQGRLLIDATVADQMIRFPTAINLLNDAREITETLVDELHKHEGITRKKPRTYR